MRVCVHETYYGQGEIRGDETYLVCLLGPNVEPARVGDPLLRALPEWYLILPLRIPVEGPMVVTTIRHLECPTNEEGMPIVPPATAVIPPETVIRITYDPDPEPPGVWRGEMVGEWTPRLVRIDRKTIWDRILGN